MLLVLVCPTIDSVISACACTAAYLSLFWDYYSSVIHSFASGRLAEKIIKFMLHDQSCNSVDWDVYQRLGLVYSDCLYKVIKSGLHYSNYYVYIEFMCSVLSVCSLRLRSRCWILLPSSKVVCLRRQWCLALWCFMLVYDIVCLWCSVFCQSWFVSTDYVHMSYVCC